jgi:hypothetical protein
MRVTKLALILLLGALFGGRMVQSQPPDHLDRGDADRGDAGQAGTQYFHQRLSPYGQWGTHASYGEVWRPRVAAGWRPYTSGHWVYSDYGWTWAADEPWGWAPFHYGRWYNDASLGWGWVPGNVWAPAWVDWRNGGGYLGWAALPPEVGFSAGVGISLGGFDLNAGLVPSTYCFVPERSILEPRLGGFILSPGRNAEIFRGTSNLRGIAMVNNRVFNQGMSVQRVEQLRGSAVPRVRVANQAAFFRPAAVANAARQAGSESFVNRPAPRAASAAARPVPAGDKGQSGRNTATRQRTQRASSQHATSPTQGRNSSGTVARSHAAAKNPPQHRAPQAAAKSQPAPRRVASASPSQRGTQRSSAKSTPPPRQAPSAKPPQRATQQGSARSNPPPRHVAAAPRQPAHAPAQAKPRQPPPPPGNGQPKG